MAGGVPQASPVIQALIDKGLFDRLPATFSTFFFDQIKDWKLLFPAEQSYHERLFALLNQVPGDELDALFAPVRQAEVLMGVNERNWPKRQFTLDQVDFLNRSPHYPAWRKAVAGIFGTLDPILDADVARRGRPRLVVVSAPGDLPVPPERLWTRIAAHGTRVPVEPSSELGDYLPLLLTGAPQAKEAPSLLDLAAGQEKAAPYSAWAIDADGVPSGLTRRSGVVRVSFERLRDYRTRLMSEVQQLLAKQDIKGPRQLGARLKTLTLRAEEGELSRDPVLGEYARTVLLAGNGTLLINNTFVEWATMQAIRRARPSVMLLGFGIRSKMKAFSSLLIFADQETASPVPTQADVLGTCVDLEMLFQYVWQEFGKYPEYRGNTVQVYVVPGTEELLITGPADFPLRAAPDKPLPLAAVHAHLREWLRL